MNTVQDVVKAGLCCGCGMCAAVCPHEALSIALDNHGYVRPLLNSDRCDECGTCVKVCPGDELDLESLIRTTFNTEPDDVYLGNFMSCHAGWSTNPERRSKAASGGIVTELLLYALEKKHIDGAFVTGISPDDPFTPRTYCARTSDEIIAARSSKYCLVPANAALKEVLKEDGAYAFVGLPCHIHALRKAQALFPNLKDSIVLVIGIFCGYCPGIKATETFLSKMNVDMHDVEDFSYRGNGWPVRIRYKKRGRDTKIIENYWGTYFFPNFFTQMRCLLCPDMLAEYADISCGDAWLPRFTSVDDQGTSVIILRSFKGEEVFKEAIEKKRVTIDHLSVDELKRSQGNLWYKKQGLRYRMKFLKRLGHAVPEFGKALSKYPHARFIEKLTTCFCVFNVWISERNIGKKILKLVPLSLIRLYSRFVSNLKILCRRKRL